MSDLIKWLKRLDDQEGHRWERPSPFLAAADRLEELEGWVENTCHEAGCNADLTRGDGSHDPCRCGLSELRGEDAS